METFETLTFLGGILMGMGILLFIFAATVAFILGVDDESES
jgi:uncharacterized membrane protein